MAISPREAAELMDAECLQLAKLEVEADDEIRMLYRPGRGPFSFTLPFEIPRSI